VPRLVVFRGDAVESEVRLSGHALRIGRHERNDIVLDDAAQGVSRFHAEIRPEGGHYVIVDLNSRNGIYANGRRIHTQAVLELGVPVTIGAFELTLEDDASGTFDAAGSPRTIATPPASRDGVTAKTKMPARSAPAPSTAARRQTLLRSAGVAVIVLICIGAFALVRYETRPTAPPTSDAHPPPPVETSVPKPPPVDPNAALNAQDLAAAAEQMAAGDYEGALRDHVQPVLERDPENKTALEYKQQAEEAIAAAAEKAARARATPKHAEPTEVETPGIPRKPSEAWGDYTARVQQIQADLAAGKASLAKEDYVTALSRFRAVERDQPNYQNVEALLADASARQQKAVDAAVTSGQQNEQAGKLLDARKWYERALEIDPSSTGAREKRASVMSRLNTEATRLFNRATFALKAQDPAAAIRQFQQILDITLPGDEIREKAVKELEALKR
jgi:predicted component of type VI protein secretion system